MLLEEFFPVAKIHEMGSGSGQGEHPLRGLSADIHYDTTMRSRRYARSAVWSRRPGLNGRPAVYELQQPQPLTT